MSAEEALASLRRLVTLCGRSGTDGRFASALLEILERHHPVKLAGKEWCNHCTTSYPCADANAIVKAVMG